MNYDFTINWRHIYKLYHKLTKIHLDLQNNLDITPIPDVMILITIATQNPNLNFIVILSQSLNFLTTRFDDLKLKLPANLRIIIRGLWDWTLYLNEYKINQQLLSNLKTNDKSQLEQFITESLKLPIGAYIKLK